MSYNLETITYVPTAFTPNGDNLNDVFQPSLEANLCADLKVYDRGGALVWKTSGEEVEWNGMNMYGEISREGVYVWVLNIVLEDGSVRELSGPVSLFQ